MVQSRSIGELQGDDKQDEPELNGGCRIPMTDNKTDSRQWTSEKPTKSGFYYYRQSDDEDPIVLKVDIRDDRRVVWLPGDNAAEPLEQCHGDWAGPIEPPA